MDVARTLVSIKIPLSLHSLPDSGFIAGVMVKQNYEEL